MKTVFVLALLVAAAYGQFFCPEEGVPYQCRKLEGYTNARAYCMVDGNWMCDYCKVKEAHCGNQLKMYVGKHIPCKEALYPDCASQKN